MNPSNQDTGLSKIANDIVSDRNGLRSPSLKRGLSQDSDTTICESSQLPAKKKGKKAFEFKKFEQKVFPSLNNEGNTFWREGPKVLTNTELAKLIEVGHEVGRQKKINADNAKKDADFKHNCKIFGHFIKRYVEHKLSQGKSIRDVDEEIDMGLQSHAMSFQGCDVVYCLYY